ncbi:hypothetical protein SAMN04488061_2913 [Filomicrobium insigne]|uniref:Uncharacterized protein n=1 Tax=Filomicrobium insigne TaxID=418854 RepID=A0A1H0SJB2_9HYPH|nr:hypothetical protein [Filomicrobium insigne]SDP41619.1 hypothetical protein SAMN04488061_2913 [Filomicrobium insigne]
MANAKLAKLAQRIEKLAEAHNPPVKVAVFAGESTRQALDRHLELRPDHRDRQYRFEWRDRERNEVDEMCATADPGELAAVLKQIWERPGDMLGRALP